MELRRGYPSGRVLDVACATRHIAPARRPRRVLSRGTAGGQTSSWSERQRFALPCSASASTRASATCCCAPARRSGPAAVAPLIGGDLRPHDGLGQAPQLAVEVL